MALASKALKRDMETILCSAQARVDGDDTTPTARKTRGLEHWITTNVSSGTSYAAPANATSALTDGTIRTFSQVLLEDTLETAFVNGAEPSYILCGPYSKRRISTFAGRSGSQVDVGKNELIVGYDVYKSDFGTLKVVPSRWSRSRTVLGIDPDFVKVAFYRDFETYDISVQGSANTKVIEVEYGLEVSHEGAHFKIADVPGTKAADPSPLT
ncbi:DUF5309 family protein [Micromonospora sp. STR1s_5]|nr:DUF5309 family protein [Micromonospora sp. STR1s_5]